MDALLDRTRGRTDLDSMRTNLGDPARGICVGTANLVSDIQSVAPGNPADPNLKNPWGMSFSSMSPFWVSNQGSNTSTLYNALTPPVKQGLTVNVPAPTGQVFNSTTSDFMIPAAVGTVKSFFLFDTLAGTIEGWNPGSKAGIHASETVATTAGAVFTGLALANFNGANYLYAANAAGNIHVFDTNFKDVTATTFAGKFVDPNPVAGFTPYNIKLLSDGHLFVTYAAATSTGAPLAGGYVDEYDTAGNFLRRIDTNAAANPLNPINAPWGLAIAPSTNFGPFSGDLLVGNLFDSKIDAYNLTTPTPHFDGSITVSTSFTSPVGLWALAFGNGHSGLADTLYFTAGINDQKDGLFGSITFVPEPSSFVLMALGGLSIGLLQVARRRHA
jgi:uncharacterized protein (TIGR03118 family)